MAREIEAAIERANDRKRAILGGARTGPVDDQAFVQVVSGFDLDPAEFLEFVGYAEDNGIRQILETRNVNLVAASLFVDGLVVGLLIAEARERKAAAR